MADRIWEGARELTRQHLQAGQRVWLVTATPVELANILARRLGLTGALGTVAETSDGVYTGRLVGGLLHGQAKAAAIRALAEREGLDLARSSAYSDSSNDLPMLELVGHPSVVNPDGDLLREARSRDWPVHEFRSARRATMLALPVAAGCGRAGRQRGRGVRAATAASWRVPLAESRAALDDKLVELGLDDVPHLIGELGHCLVVGLGGLGSRSGQGGGRHRIAELDDPVRRQRHRARSGRATGNSGVSGKYGSRSALASASELPIIG